MIKDQNVLVMDGAIHSGTTMKAVIDALKKHGAKQICSYGLILKRGAVFVPSIWGMVIDDYDRAYYLLTRLPNLRLQKFKAFAHLRMLSQDDLKARSSPAGSHHLTPLRGLTDILIW